MDVLKTRGAIRAGLAAGCLAAAVAGADELPFYRAGAEPAARVAAATATSAAGVPLDSRTVQSAESAEVRFDSSGIPGALILVR